METKREEQLLPDYKDRRAAITGLDSNIVVIAGAGTGKTTLLIDRILHLLFARELPVESLVILTITEKAAGEMKVRLVEKLKYIHQALFTGISAERDDAAPYLKEPGREKALEIIKRTFENLDRAQIGTIHGFAAHILRLFPLEAGVDPAFEVDEADSFNAVFDLEWGRWLETELAAASARREQWLKVLSRVELDQVEKLSRKLSDFSVPLEWLKEKKADTGGITARYASEIKSLLPLAAKGRKIDRLALALDKVLSRISKDGPGDPYGGLSGDERQLLGESPSKNTAGWAPRDADKLNEIRKFACSLAELDEELMGTLTFLLTPFIENFRIKYTREGFVSFSGLLALSRNLLQENAAVRERLKSEYRAVLVDEFQDTDPVQMELLLFLAEKKVACAGTWEKIRLEPGKLFIVGDPKQSIYRFRGADIVAFQAVRELIKGQGGREYALATNFRSNSGIISLVNTVFSGLIRKKENIQPEYNPIIAAPSTPAPQEWQKPELLLMCDGPDDRDKSLLSTHQSRETEARKIAAWIDANRGKLEIRRRDSSVKLLEYKDMAIILRALTQVHVYLEELRNFDIPFVVEGEKSFYETQEVIDFVNLIRAIENPENKIALVGLLRSPLGGLDDRDIYELRRAGRLDYRSGRGAAGPASRLFGVLRTLHGLTGRLSVNKLLDEILDSTYIMEICAQSYHKEQALANIMKFRRVATDAAARGVTTLRELSRLMQEYVSEGIDEGEDPLADDTYDAVRVLSIHKSKGLEYPVVFMPNLHGAQNPPPSDEPAVIADWGTRSVGINIKNPGIKNLNMLALEAESKKRESEESARLLYVACTRSRDKLFLLGNSDPKKMCPLNRIRAHAFGRENAPDPGILEVSYGYYSELVRAEKRNPRKAVGEHAAGWDKLLALAKKRERSESEALGSSVFLSPSALAKEQEKLFTRYDGGDAAPKNKALLLGTVCHRILEKWDYELSSLEDLAGSVVDRELQPGCGVSGREEMLSEALGILRGFAGTREFADIKGGEILGREVPFIMPWQGSVMRGTIDLIYRNKKGTVIADFKTDRPPKEGAKEKEKKYELQAKIYREAVSRILKVKDPEVKFVFLRDTLT
jgi:ATP-dependent helicase/nuclease subunit A